ncbi:hypothetical protein SAMN05216588_11071 [Pseudomonas flavescens]|uniref:Haloacid dehalogenase n=1 Tax=Phytopseudomonas flavescens TaxID=29435 RepID=A0A1G8H5W2_9GAMM|nr:haloacid dehalogenase [Pseudomonas flavescens]SDI02015.1 hypothetical protein SAMN05216588_11071 [Pseudomonas flavescens]
MKVTQYKALGFSLGTVVDRERGILDGLRSLAVHSTRATSDEQLLQAYRQLASELSHGDEALSSASLHARLYQRMAQQLLVIPDWEAHVAFSNSTAQWPIFEDAPGALQYLSKFYRLLLVAPPHGSDVQALLRRLPVAFDAVVEPNGEDWHRSLEGELQRLQLVRPELLPVRSTEADDPWAQRVDFPVCTLRRDNRSPWNRSPQALDGKRCEYASLADLAHAHQLALHA